MKNVITREERTAFIIEKIEESLKLLTIAPHSIPLTYIRYSGNKTTYIVFHIIHDGNMAYSDGIKGGKALLQIDVFSKNAKDYKLRDRVVSLLEEAGIECGKTRDLYESDTKTYHFLSEVNLIMEETKNV